MLQYSIITITAFVTLLNEVVIYIAKETFGVDVKKYIPLISIVFGIIMGLISYFSNASFMSDLNLVESIFVGISSGASAVGINQVGKQLNKPIDGQDESNENDKSTEDIEP